MNWDTLFHREQDLFRKEHRKLPKFLYAGQAFRKSYETFTGTKVNGADLSYAGVEVLWVNRKNWFKFHV